MGAPTSPRNFVSTARLKDPRARGGCAWSRGNERRLQWIQSRRLREASLEVHLCASRAARLLYGASAWMRWHLFGACFVIARHISIWRGVSRDPPPIGWIPVAPGSRPYSFGMIVGGEEVSASSTHFQLMARAPLSPVQVLHVFILW